MGQFLIENLILIEIVIDLMSFGEQDEKSILICDVFASYCCAERTNSGNWT